MPSYPEAKIVAFLSSPEAYQDAPSRMERIETHMSWVFIAGDLVYKMKKAIRLDFVDFTMLEARRRNCELEVALNRMLASDVYLGVVPLVRAPGGALAIGGRGVPVEWLVKMRRLDLALMLDRAISAGSLTDTAIDQICDVLAAFYADTARVEMAGDAFVEWWRVLAGLAERSLVDERFALPAASVQPPLEFLHRFLDREAALLSARAEQGRIVDGHGDLRPEHVHLGPPTLIIDRLEFDARLRRVDPFDEVEFLGLECAHLGAPWIGARLRDGIAQRLGERPPERLLTFYRCYRACLRARISIEHLRDAKPRTPERWPRQALAYLALAGEAAAQLQS